MQNQSNSLVTFDTQVKTALLVLINCYIAFNIIWFNSMFTSNTHLSISTRNLRTTNSCIIIIIILLTGILIVKEVKSAAFEIYFPIKQLVFLN